MMQTTTDQDSLNDKLERVGNILRIAGWAGICIQLALAAVSSLMLLFAISGRSLNRAIAPAVPGYAPGATVARSATIPGIGIGIFWAVLGVLVLLFSVFLAYRQTRYAKRLRHPEVGNHPQRAEVVKTLQMGVMVGLIGMLLMILGGGASLGVLLSKSLIDPQGVAIYDPNRAIRSLDVFVAMANLNGIAAHFLGTTASLGLLRWLHR